MNDIIPNSVQFYEIMEIYSKHYATRGICIRPDGQVDEIHPTTSLKVGQVVVIDGYLMCYTINANRHYLIWEDTLRPIEPLTKAQKLRNKIREFFDLAEKGKL